jgi:DNA adenine methylase
MPLTDDFYYALRNEDPKNLAQIDAAARFIYLNRNCFNGVYRTNRAGQFNVPKGSRVGDIPSEGHFMRCAIALRKATLLSGDFEMNLHLIKKGDFVYLDPPYAKEGSRHRGEYGYASFNTTDIARLNNYLAAIDSIGATFLLSYAMCKEIKPITRSWNTRSILVKRHVAGFSDKRALVREVLISNRRLLKPLVSTLHLL